MGSSVAEARRIDPPAPHRPDRSESVGGGAGARPFGRIGPFAPLEAGVRAQSLRETLDAAPDRDDVWVFAYASLIWRPCFEAAAARRLLLPGYRRAFCVWTVQARGRPERPGLGLGLEAGGPGCEGMALQVPAARLAVSLEALWAREMLTGVYLPRWLCGRRENGEGQSVLAFVADCRHPQYAGGLSDEERAACIASARGELGSCLEYLEHSVSALRGAGITDPYLDAMRDRVRGAAGPAPDEEDGSGAT